MTIASGTCGDNLTWVLEDDYSLVISGSGAMDNYTLGPRVPWYQYNANIISVTLPSGITSIGDLAFSGCTALTSVIIPSGVTSIGGNAFEGCSALTSVSIPDTVTSIAGSVFRNCTSLTSLTIPDGVTSISYRMCYNCTALTSITIPNSITAINNYAFSGCTSLTAISLGDQISNIYSSAFQNCPSLTRIELQSVPASIGTNAFSLGTSTHPVTCVVESPGNIANGAFDSYKNNYTTFTYHGIGEYIGSDGLTYTFINNALTISGTGASTSLYYGQLTLSDSTTMNMRSMTSCSIGAGITSIGGTAFSLCTALVSITVSEDNANYSSEDGVLFDKTKTTLIRCPLAKTGTYSIPNTVTTLSSEAFYGCSGLTFITIPSSVTAIPYKGFMSCSSLSSVSIPLSVTSIGNYAFTLCTSLTSVIIPASVTTLGDACFNSCTALKRAIISAHITAIPDNLFGACSSLENVSFPASPTSIGEFAFGGCTSLSSIVIPDTVTSIGNGAFKDCTGLKSITLSLESSIITDASSAVFEVWGNCTNIETATITKSTASAYDYSIDNYQHLPWYISRAKFKTLTFATGCVKVPQYSFKGCTSLETVVLPDTVTALGTGAFTGCTEIATLTIPIDISYNDLYAALNDTRKLQTINFTAGATGLGTDFINENSSFWGKSSATLTSVSFASEITKIGTRTLDGCSLVNSSLDLQDVTLINYYAFRGCSSVPSVSLGSSLEAIQTGAFRGCSQMRLTTSLGSTALTTIWDHAFDGCSNLQTNLTVPVNVTALGAYAFANCTSLVHVTIDQAANHISATPPIGCFAGCTSLETVTWTDENTRGLTPDDVLDEMYMGCTSLKTIPLYAGETTCRFNSYGARCFKGCTSLSTIVFDNPSSSMSIGGSAFENCTGVQNITFHNAFGSIGLNAFKGCSSVEIITFEKALGSGTIANGSFMLGLDENNEVYAVARSLNFWAQNELEDTDVKGEYTHFTYMGVVDYYIGTDGLKYSLSPTGKVTVTNETGTPKPISAFSYGTLYTNDSQHISFEGYLTELEISDDVTGVAQNAFRHTVGRTVLQKVTYSESSFEIGGYAFCACSKLTTVRALTDGSQVTIGTGAFYGCAELTDVDDMGDYETLNYETFARCYALQHILLPASLETINAGAFEACTSLTAFYVSEDNVNFSAVDGILYDKTQTTLVLYPYGLQNTYLAIPEGVVTIGTRAFENNPVLTSVEFPTSLRAIDDYAFRYCSNLNSLYFKGSTPVIFGSQVFAIGTVGSPATIEVRSYDDWADNMLEPYANPYTTFVYVTTGYIIQFISTEGVELSETRKTHTNGILDEFPEMPARTSELIFLGWSDSQSYEVWTPVTAPHKFTGNTILYAKWRDIPFAYSMVFVLAPGTVNVADINDCWKVRPIADDQTTIGSWREISDGVYRWGYDPPEGEAEDNLAITLITPTDAQIDAPNGMKHIRSEGPRWYSLAPYVPIDDVEVSGTLARRGGDHIFTAVFYPNWEPARVPSGSRALIIAPGMQMLDFGEIQGVTKSYRANNTVLPIVCYGYRRSFVMDLGTSCTVSLKYIRVQPHGSVTVGGTTYTLPWDQSTDSRHWSNAKWAEYLRTYMDRWQMRTNGQQLYILNPGNANGTAPERFPDNAMCEIDGANCYIASAPISYGTAGPDVLSGSVEFDLGTLYPKKETPIMRAVTFALGGEYASHWGTVSTRTYNYPEGGIIILPEYFWDASVSEIDTSGSGAVYSITGWVVNNELYLPGTLIHMDEVTDQTEITIYAMTSECTITADNYFKTNGKEGLPRIITFLRGPDPQDISAMGEFTVTIDEGRDDASVNIILVGGGGGGAAAKTMEYQTYTSSSLISYSSVLIAGGGGGGAGRYVANTSDSAWPIYRTPENNGVQTYRFRLGAGGPGHEGTDNAHEVTNTSVSGCTGVSSTVSILQGDNELQLMEAAGGVGGQTPSKIVCDDGKVEYQSSGGKGSQYPGGSGGKATVDERNSMYFSATVRAGDDGSGVWNHGSGSSPYSNGSMPHPTYISGAGGGAGLPQAASGDFTDQWAGNGGAALISNLTDDNSLADGSKARYGCGGGGGGARLGPANSTSTWCGKGGGGGRGYIIVYVIGGKITSRRFTGYKNWGSEES